MTIKGLSESRRMPRIGKIHLGVKKVNSKGVEYPAATEYFVVPPEIATIYGEKPTELPIMIPVEDDELWANQYYKRYSKTRGLVCRGDGEKCKRMIDIATGDVANRNTKDVVWKFDLPCEGKLCPSYLAKECSETMNLQFILPDVAGLGVWQVDTKSIYSILNINSAAAMVRAVFKRIAFVPLTLTLEPTEVVNPEDGKKKTVRCLNFRVRGTMRELMAQTVKPYTELLLPPPEDTEAALDTADGISLPPNPLNTEPPEDAGYNPDDDFKKLESAFRQPDIPPTKYATIGQCTKLAELVKAGKNLKAKIEEYGWAATKPSELTYDQAERLIKECSEAK